MFQTEGNRNKGGRGRPSDSDVTLNPAALESISGEEAGGKLRKRRGEERGQGKFGRETGIIKKRPCSDISQPGTHEENRVLEGSAKNLKGLKTGENLRQRTKLPGRPY